MNKTGLTNYHIGGIWEEVELAEYNDWVECRCPEEEEQ